MPSRRQLLRAFVVIGVASVGCTPLRPRSVALAPEYPGFCLNPVTGETQPRYDDLCPDAGIVCPMTAGVSALGDGPGVGYQCRLEGVP